jgi:ferredoxin--NADP+ reductase
LLDDLRDAPRKGHSAEEVEARLLERGVRLVVYEGWTSIDERERVAGEPLGRPRVKLCTWDELLAAAGLEPSAPRV